MFLYGKGKRLVWKCTLPEISMVCFRRDRVFIHVIDRSVLLYVSPKSGIKGQSFLKQSYFFGAPIFSLIAFDVSLPIKYKPFKIVIRLRKTFVLEEIHQEQMFRHKCSKKKKPWRTHSPFSLEEHLLSFLFYTFFDLTVLIILRPHISPLVCLWSKLLLASNFNFIRKRTPSQIQNFD